MYIPLTQFISLKFHEASSAAYQSSQTITAYCYCSLLGRKINYWEDERNFFRRQYHGKDRYVLSKGLQGQIFLIFEICFKDQELLPGSDDWLEDFSPLGLVTGRTPPTEFASQWKPKDIPKKFWKRWFCLWVLVFRLVTRCLTPQVNQGALLPSCRKGVEISHCNTMTCMIFNFELMVANSWSHHCEPAHVLFNTLEDILGGQINHCCPSW